MTHEPPTIDEMLAEDEERGPLEARAALDAITRTAREDDVVVTVDLHGKLIGLELGQRAMASRPAALAARLSRLTAVAAEAALAAGAEVLAAVLDEPVAAGMTTGPAASVTPVQGHEPIGRSDRWPAR